jgi:large conductance mechanosensitive channel protein
MQTDSEGFSYPVIDAESCIDCNLCRKVCPFINSEREKNDKPQTVYSCVHKDEDTLRHSTSGGAFTAIVNSLSNNILKPFINYLLALILGKDALSEIYTFLGDPVLLADGTIDLANSIYIDWGAFINAIINFFLIAVVLFLIVRTINNLRRRLDAKEIAAAEAKAKAEAEVKAAAEAEAAAVAAREQEIRDQFYANVARQTELLEKIASK